VCQVGIGAIGVGADCLYGIDSECACCLRGRARHLERDELAGSCKDVSRWEEVRGATWGNRACEDWRTEPQVKRTTHRSFGPQKTRPSGIDKSRE
jgi:hypothetical protein